MPERADAGSYTGAFRRPDRPGLFGAYSARPSYGRRASVLQARRLRPTLGRAVRRWGALRASRSFRCMGQGRLEKRLRRLVTERGGEAVVVVDDDGRVLMMSNAARDLAGVDVLRLFLERNSDVHSFRAQLRVGWNASCQASVQGQDGVTRRLALEGRAIGELGVVTVRDVTATPAPSPRSCPSPSPSRGR